MPFAFPSHQGLIAPLWRRWPGRFHVLGLCVGAATPDIVDGIMGPIFKGGLGQWLGHTLVGLFVFCVPVGILVTWLMAHSGNWLLKWTQKPWAIWYSTHLIEWNSIPRRIVWKRWFVVFSVWLGALSHLFFDFISHGRFLWLYPWYEDKHFFPEWWYVAWFRLPLPGYRESYPVGPHLMVWLFLGILGAVMLFWPLIWKKTTRNSL
ncbi:MAG TPA: DUF4184 family protein [Candidatus Hydrogenedentes bacterium]|nr:DUF4184 family protein [Candidatus Hydrogenedentota bacterium]